ncbi:DeoR family transcriptional regulator [Spirochaetia bacterium]|nr:DeoR family transcriptional regulator [Spirochaetia bacterium]
MRTKDFSTERQQTIIQHINSESRVNVEDLARLFNVTTATIRRDLIVLEKHGHLFRAHGGAVKREPVSVWQMSSLQTRLAEHEAEKLRIADYAASLISDGESIMIDGGSTTTKTAYALKAKKNLLTVTNALTIAEILSAAGKHKIILSGGELLQETNALVGTAAEHSLECYRVDTAILGVSGLLPTAGAFSAIPQEAEIKRIMLANSARNIIVTDSSKIGVQAFYRFCEMTQIDVLITDTHINTTDLSFIRELGCEVVAV